MALLSLQTLLYGRLRAIETEQLYEKAWFAVTETCLAMTIFRDEVGVCFMVMFIALLIGKVATWISNGRLDLYEQQPPANPTTFHVRLTAALCVTYCFNASLFFYTLRTVLREARPNMMVMFAFEYAVLLVASTSICCRYAVLLSEAAIIRRQVRMNGTSQGDSDEHQISEEELNGWENKRLWLFYLDIGTGELCPRLRLILLTLPSDLCKIVLYLAFFGVLCVFFGMPIHIVRDVAITLRSFYKRISDFMHYKAATRDMDTLYPDAGEAEIQREDCCIICRDTMKVPETQQNGHIRETRKHRNKMKPKILGCGHVLHLFCLKSWLERQQNCPICRAPVLSSGTESQQTRQYVPTDNSDVVGHSQREETQTSVLSQTMLGDSAPVRRQVPENHDDTERSVVQQRSGSGQETSPLHERQIALDSYSLESSEIQKLLDAEITDASARLNRLQKIRAKHQGRNHRNSKDSVSDPSHSKEL